MTRDIVSEMQRRRLGGKNMTLPRNKDSLEYRVRMAIETYMNLYEKHRVNSPWLADVYLITADKKAQILGRITDFHKDCVED